MKRKLRTIYRNMETIVIYFIVINLYAYLIWVWYSGGWEIGWLSISELAVPD
jgi:hypothetical protein